MSFRRQPTRTIKMTRRLRGNPQFELFFKPNLRFHRLKFHSFITAQKHRQCLDPDWTRRFAGPPQPQTCCQ